MIYIIIALRDIKADTHEPPMFVPNVNVAIRDLADMVKDPQGKMAWQRHPEDFELWELGRWDATTGLFDTDDEHKRQLCALSTLKG